MKKVFFGLLLFSAVISMRMSLAAEKAVARNNVYKGEVAVLEKLRTEGVPEKFSYIFHETGEWRGVLKISAPDYYYWVFVSDWERSVFGQTVLRSNEHSGWYKVVWQSGKPAEEMDAAIVERIGFFMHLIKPRIAKQIEAEKGRR